MSGPGDDERAAVIGGPQLAAEIDALVDENEQLREALTDAIDCIEHWAGYASDYFREKWDLDGDLARLRAFLARTDTGGQPDV